MFYPLLYGKTRQEDRMISFILVVLLFSIIALFLGLKSYGNMPVKKDLKNGEQLSRQVGDILWSIGRTPVKLELFSYKYFHEMCLSLLEASRRFGVDISENFLSIQKQLKQDLSFEKEQLHLRTSGLIEFLLCGVMVSMLCFYMFYSINVYEYQLVFQIILIQFIGLYGYLCVEVILRNRAFNRLFVIGKTLTIMTSLSESSGTIKHLKKSLDLNKLKSSESSYQSQVINRIEELFEMWRKRGVPPTKELSFLLQEHWCHVRLIQTKMGQKLKILRFFVQVVFFLLPYLYFISNLSVMFMNHE